MILASGFTDEASQLILARSMGQCEIMAVSCNTMASEIHHRRPRGMGGTNRESSAFVSNGLAACRHCHNHVERNRTWGRENGFLIGQSGEPELVPVWWRSAWKRSPRGHWVKKWVLLDNHGGHHEITSL